MTNAVLFQDVSILLRDVSTSGCLLESGVRLPVGTVGTLHVDFGGRRRLEWFRVSRPHDDAADGGGSRLFGVEFLPLTMASPETLRGAIGRSRVAGRVGGMPEVAGRSSGDPGKSARPPRGTTAESAHEPGVASHESTEFARRVVDFTRPGSEG